MQDHNYSLVSRRSQGSIVPGRARDSCEDYQHCTNKVAWDNGEEKVTTENWNPRIRFLNLSETIRWDEKSRMETDKETGKETGELIFKYDALLLLLSSASAVLEIAPNATLADYCSHAGYATGTPSMACLHAHFRFSFSHTTVRP